MQTMNPRLAASLPLLLLLVPRTLPAQNPYALPQLRSYLDAYPSTGDQEPPPSVTTFGFEADGESIVVRSDEHGITVTRNGEAMPDDRVQRGDHQVVITDADHRPLASVQLWGHGGTLTTLARRKIRVHLGVTLEPVGETLASQLGLDRDRATVVADVQKDGPAAAAGIQPHDVLVAIAGEAPATQERLQKVLADEHPGDRLELTVLRHGERKTIEVELAKAADGVPVLGDIPLVGDLFTRTPGSQSKAADAYTRYLGQLGGKVTLNRTELLPELWRLNAATGTAPTDSKALMDKLDKLLDQLERLEKRLAAHPELK